MTLSPLRCNHQPEVALSGILLSSWDILTTVAKAALEDRASALRMLSTPCPVDLESSLAEVMREGWPDGNSLLHTCDGVCTARTAAGSLLAMVVAI